MWGARRAATARGSPVAHAAGKSPEIGPHRTCWSEVDLGMSRPRYRTRAGTLLDVPLQHAAALRSAVGLAMCCSIGTPAGVTSPGIQTVRPGLRISTHLSPGAGSCTGSLLASPARCHAGGLTKAPPILASQAGMLVPGLWSGLFDLAVFYGAQRA